MNIDIQRDGTVLTAIPEGRIDTLTAPEFQKQMEAERDFSVSSPTWTGTFCRSLPMKRS